MNRLKGGLEPIRHRNARNGLCDILLRRRKVASLKDPHPHQQDVYDQHNGYSVGIHLYTARGVFSLSCLISSHLLFYAALSTLILSAFLFSPLVFNIPLFIVLHLSSPISNFTFSALSVAALLSASNSRPLDSFALLA